MLSIGKETKTVCQVGVIMQNVRCRGECFIAFVASAAIALLGSLLVIYGKEQILVVHGAMMALAGGLGLVFVVRRMSGPAIAVPLEYNDGIIRTAVVLTLLWGIVGFAVGDMVAWQLAFPDLNYDMPWTNFGRLRPVHTTGVILGFGGNALLATSFYVVQRTSRARLAGQVSPQLVLWGYNLFVLLGVTGYIFGVTQSREYAEPEWYADLLATIVWVGYLSIYLATLARRAERHIYVANWYFLGFIIAFAMLHIVNNLSIPVSLEYAKSYSLFTGVQDAMTQWWYGHNAVGFFLTAAFLGMLYYFLPKAAGRPIYSYRLGIIGFWGLVFVYMWVGSHHLHYTALPDWVQTLGMSMSVILLVPSWATVFNGFFTLNGAWHRLRTDPALRFMALAVLFYAISTFEGVFMALKPVNALSHYTDWTVGHVHAGALGWVAFITFGSMYKLVPWVWHREGTYSRRLEAWHFWLALSGTIIYVGAMWNAGITQSLMWQTYDANGQFIYAFIDTVEAMHPYYVARAFGGLLYFIGFALGAFNLWLTIHPPQPVDIPTTPDTRPLPPEGQTAPAPATAPAE